MTSKRANLLQRVAALPDELPPEVEQSIDEIEDWHQGVYRLSADEREAVHKGLAAAKNGEFVPNDEMAEFRTRNRR